MIRAKRVNVTMPRDLYITATSRTVTAEYQSQRAPTVKDAKILRGRSAVAGLPIPPTDFVLG